MLMCYDDATNSPFVEGTTRTKTCTVRGTNRHAPQDETHGFFVAVQSVD
jgi:hypothetical protein